ncbi:hypothetical protein H2200_010437 [Cladophialophora chaetospira]|uniref:Uncharacterized protein n=1 Tax=Cladophialophora chaetospira TaxID=386627 RepID=A0AA39CEB4_9EURO|nr:hypothetical protein H2200_010437 [Cladophialophora chaetospira]
MHPFTAIAAAGIFAYQAMAQTAAFNPPITFTNVTLGQTQKVGWTVGDGTPVSLFLGNTTWNSAIFENKPASDAWFDWTVADPDGLIPGNYALALVQSGSMDFSPLFMVNFPTGFVPAGGNGGTSSGTSSPTPTPLLPNSTVTADPNLISSSATWTAAPLVTVTVWDPECGCHKTSQLPAAAVATGSGVPGTQYTWYDNECGCTKTAMAPAPTTNWGSNNYTAPTSGNVPVAPSVSVAPAPAAPSQSSWTGAADKLAGSTVAVLGLVAAVLLA